MNDVLGSLDWATLIPTVVGGVIAGLTGWIAAIAIHNREKRVARENLTTAIYKEIEDQKYNSQIQHINNASERAGNPLRAISNDAVVKDEGSTQFDQRVGFNDEDDKTDIFS